MKGKATLKKGAVPTVFVVDEDHGSTNEVINDNVENDRLHQMMTDEKLVYTMIFEKKQEVPLPSSKWSFLCTAKFTAWMNWTDSTDFSCKRVILYPDLKVQVNGFINFFQEENNSMHIFLFTLIIIMIIEIYLLFQVFVKDIEAKLEVQQVEKISDLTALLEKVDNFLPCGSISPDE